MRLIKLDENGFVIQVRNNAKEKLNNEIESEMGYLGQKLEDGAFIDVQQDFKEETDLKEEILFETKYQTMLIEMLAF